VTDVGGVGVGESGAKRAESSPWGEDEDEDDEASVSDVSASDLWRLRG
jgi:hypothetical protein